MMVVLVVVVVEVVMVKFLLTSWSLTNDCPLREFLKNLHIHVDN